MSDESLKRSLRHELKRRRLGRDDVCPRCGEPDIRALQKSGESTICAECRLKEQGLPPYERHHPAGRSNDPFVVPNPANIHASLSDDQVDWPEETLRNPDGDIFHALAAWMRGIHDTLVHIALKLGEWAVTLEYMARFLEERIGPNWWKEFLAYRK